MERFNALGRGAQLMLVGSVLLLIVSFFSWQDFGDAGLVTRNAWHGLGVIMGLLTIVLIAWLVARLAAVGVPVPVSLTGAVLAFLILACAVILNLADDYSTFWSYLGVGLAAVVAVGAWMQVQEAGGIENLKSEIPGSAATAAPAAAAPAEAASAEPAPAPPEAPADPAPEQAVGESAPDAADTDPPPTDKA